MAPANIGPLRQAVVKALRANSALKAGVNNEFHEGLAHREVEFPYCIFEFVWTTRAYDWTKSTLACGLDVWILSEDSVQASNLDALVIEALHDKALDMGTSGMSVLYCRRISDASVVDIDDSGRKVYQIGGTHEIWLDVPA